VSVTKRAIHFDTLEVQSDERLLEVPKKARISGPCFARQSKRFKEINGLWWYTILTIRSLLCIKGLNSLQLCGSPKVLNFQYFAAFT